MSERQLDRVQSATVMIEKAGRFFFYQPSLGVIASDAGIDSAYRRFLDARQHYLDEVTASGVALASPIPEGGRSGNILARHDLTHELMLFLMKTGIVLLLVMVVVVVAATSVGGALARLGDRLTAIAEPLNSISIVDVADKAAVIVKDIQAMPPERKESLKRSIGIISRELDPIAEAWRNPTPAPAR
jgi:hypothetical protein